MQPLSQILTYIVTGITGAIRIVKLDIHGFAYFGDKNEDFWWSFLGAALLAPIFIIYLTIKYFESPLHDNFLPYIIAKMLTFSITWLTFPLIMLYVAPVLNRNNQVVRYLVAYNWVSVIQNGIYLPIGILGYIGIFPDPITSFLAVVVLMWVLGMSLFVARTGLNISFLTAAGVVFMDLLLGLIIEVITNRV